MSIDLNDLASALGKIILRFRVRRRTADEWVTINEVLLNAEIGLETDTDKFKFGNGIDPWVDLPYSGVGDPLSSANAGLGISIDKVFPGTPTDPDWTDVSLLMHFNGDTKDSSPNRFAVASSGTATTTGTGMKYGSGAGSIPGPGGYWKVSDDPAFDFAAGDWTIEGWFYPTDYVSGSTFPSVSTFGKFANPAGGATAVLGVICSALHEVYLTDSSNGTHHLKFFDYQIVSTTDATHVIDNPNPFAKNQWNHIAVTRVGNKLHVFMNGFDCPCDKNDPGYPTTPPGGYDIGSITLNSATSDFQVGAGAGSFSSAVSFGKVDDFRVTKGVARYSANFTPPASEFYSSDTPLILQITNTGVRSVVAGDNVIVDDTDPYNPIVSSTGGGGSGISPDKPPTIPSPFDDEFEYGTVIDTAGARFSGANSWTVRHYAATSYTNPQVSQGYMGAALTGSENTLMTQPIPSGSFSFVMKTKRVQKSGNNGWTICLYNSTTNNITLAELYSGSPSVAIAHGTINSSTNAFSATSGPFSDSTTFSTADDWMWVRIRYDSSAGRVYYAWNDTGHDAMWKELYSELTSAFIGSFNEVGMLIFSNNQGVVDYFRRTA